MKIRVRDGDIEALTAGPGSWQEPAFVHVLSPKEAGALAMDLARAVVEVDPVRGAAVIYGTGFRGDDGRCVDPRIVRLHDDGTWSVADEGER